MLGEVLVFGSALTRGAAFLLVVVSLSKGQAFRGAMMDAMPAITGVAEIVLNVRDLPKMRDFYQEVLGFKLLSEACHETGPEPDADGEPTIAFLTIKGVDTPLRRHGHPQLLAAESTSSDTPLPRGDSTGTSQLDRH